MGVSVFIAGGTEVGAQLNKLPLPYDSQAVLFSQDHGIWPDGDGTGDALSATRLIRAALVFAQTVSPWQGSTPKLGDPE